MSIRSSGAADVFLTPYYNIKVTYSLIINFMKKYLLIALIISANCIAGFTQSTTATPVQGGSIVLRGTIILPNSVIKHGYVAIVDGRIASISDKPPTLANAVTVNTNGIILPGLVDVHNHVPYNVFPRWIPGRVFTNRNQWRTDPEVIAKIEAPMDQLESSYSCDMNHWGELRGLVGGTTSMMVTQPQPCISGLVRNLDFNSGFYGTTELDREHIFNVLDLPPANNPAARAAFVGAARFFIANPFYEALFIHLAEGTDAAAYEEFTFMQSQSLVNAKGVVIHGIPLTAADFQSMGRNGTALVWSPRSNLELYGTTTNIQAALDAGVEIALAPDWAVTGSSNMLNELKVADQWNRERLGGRLTDKQLVDMVTSAPAHIAGVDDQVGSITVGLRADLLVINGDHNKPYRAVIDGTAADVDIVFINGVPLYGDRKFMKHFWDNSELEEIRLPGAIKTLATPAANLVVANIESRLNLALQTEGVSLAPLVEADHFVLSSAAFATHRRANSPNEHMKEVTQSNTLKVTAMANPALNYFTLRTQSSSDQPLQLKVLDMFGRIVETRTGIAANSTFHIGNQLRGGVYLVEVIQGDQRQTLKLIRQ